MRPVKTHRHFDRLRQALILLASPLIWVFSTLGIYFDSARSPEAFSDLSVNILVPFPAAFSIWFPIFTGILIYGVVQTFPDNQKRPVFRDTGWWMVGGLWGVALWGLTTAFAPDNIVELLASLIFIPTMLCLVMAMIKVWSRRSTLDRLEKWLILTPISLIAGWCSIAIFIGINGLIWSYAEIWGWHVTGTALSVLGLALWWVIYILRQHARNIAYAIPVMWGLGFLIIRHIGEGGNSWIATAGIIGLLAVLPASVVKQKTT